ncbi:MAG: rhomboid family intramembrane serine protease [Planctomycetaceae bacterium]|nr:rhomboid family intramembrane serine protease [Planctomycetaceae bacterium]
MGVYDRDYYRTDPAGSGLMGGVAPVCKWLIAVNIGVYVLQLLAFDNVTSWLDLNPERVVKRFEVWRLVTSAFLHSQDLWHIVGNMFFLWICGRNVEPIYGRWEFLRFYLAAAAFSGACFVAFAYVIGQMTPAIGASGAVMAVVMVCALYYPTQQIMLMLLIPVPLWALVWIYAIYDLHPVLLELGGREPNSGVANIAHLGGFLYGYLYKKFDLRFSRLLGDLSWPKLKQLVRSRSVRRNSDVRLYEPPEERRTKADLERQVDEILAKISAEGEASLTDSERNTLKEASRRYKRR